MKRIIWTSETNIEDYREFFEEQDITSENEQYECLDEMNRIWLEDERMNRDIELEENIVILADLGLWFGRRDGYKEIGNNISEALYTNDDYITWYVDGYDMRGDGAHHDGWRTS